ncbi:MAG: nucleotidyltransferase domain-containing protein [Deltaproteobacteria bacterium]|nr:nucleotidyltransferase domain-containing protein [Deltaproteobacteria bacterium]
MSQIDLQEKHLRTLLEILARHVPQSEVWAYGSRVSHTGHEGSDLDLVLRNPSRLEEPTTGWADLKEALEDSSLPMMVELHDWARLPQPFRDEIQRKHLVLWEGDKPNNLRLSGEPS